MTNKNTAGLKEFKDAQAMVLKTDKAITALEKSFVKEEVKSSLTLQEKRMFSNMGADNEVAMMLFQDFLFAGVNLTFFDGNMIDMLGIAPANEEFVGMAAQVTQEVVVESYEDKRKEYLSEQKAEMLEKQRVYEAEQQRELALKKKNERIKDLMYFLAMFLLNDMNKLDARYTVPANSDEEENNNNVVNMFSLNKDAYRQMQPAMSPRNQPGFKMALSL